MLTLPAGNAFNQFANPIALAAITWKYYAVYIGIDIIVLALIYFFFPETKNLTIEEVSLVFDYGLKGDRKRAAEDMGRNNRTDGEGLKGGHGAKSPTPHLWKRTSAVIVAVTGV
jgi:hypothetical protein